MDPNEKIQLDDITFDEVIAGDGVATETIDEVAPPQEDEQSIESAEEDELPELDEYEDEADEDEDEDDEDYEDDEDEEYEDEYEDEYEEEYEDDDEETEDYNDTVVAEVLDKLGYNPEDADYEDTADGLANLTSDVASQMADDRIDEVLEAFPLVKQHLEYVLQGGESQDFMQAHDPSMDYDKLILDEEDSRTQKGILQEYFTVKGHDPKFINELLEDYEDAGKLYGKAEAARGALAQLQDKQRAQMHAEQKQYQMQQQADLSEFWSGVAEKIDNSESFAGLTVPEREKEDFFDYLSTPVTREGHTQRDLDHMESDMDVKLAIDYLMYRGFNLEDIIDTKARTKSAISLRDKIGRGEETLKSARRSSRRSKNVNLDDLDLSI